MSFDAPIRRVPVALAIVTTIALGAAASTGAWAQASDKNAEKAARRAQLQMQRLQQQVQDAQAAKAKIEADKAALDKLLGSQAKQLAQLQGALPRATQGLKEAQAQQARLSAEVAALEKRLADQKTATEEALAAKGRELTERTQAHDELQVQAQRKFDEQGVSLGECTSKNERLIRLNLELLDRYRSKTAMDILKQREPALGFGEVKMFNLIQDYRDKAEVERYSPPINR